MLCQRGIRWRAGNISLPTLPALQGHRSGKALRLLAAPKGRGRQVSLV
ncbi:MAG: hypothetical protein GXX96_08580 [Planctomycetaceae bacterium]|nr:hypothetical protein [Planctomycetaceae bacterium]